MRTQHTEKTDNPFSELKRSAEDQVVFETAT